MKSKKKEFDELMRKSLKEAMRIDQEMLEEKLKNTEPHVFSEEFERKMGKVIADHRKRCKRRAVIRFSAKMAACLLLCVLCVGLVTANHTAMASLPSIDIKGWFEKYFEFSKGEYTEDSEIVFSEAQILYIPEGFTKTEEEVTRTYRNYVYENEEDKNFSLRVSRTIVQTQQDNEAIEREIFKAENRYEYARTRHALKTIYVWEDDEGLYYYLSGNIEEKELELVMISIQEGVIK